MTATERPSARLVELERELRKDADWLDERAKEFYAIANSFAVDADRLDERRKEVRELRKAVAERERTRDGRLQLLTAGGVTTDAVGGGSP